MSPTVGRPRGSGWVQEALTSRMPAGEFTVAEAAAVIGTSRESVSHAAGKMVRDGYLVRARQGVYRHLTEEEWDAR
jgi:predicted transcriptional regulator of viral defense system